MCSYLSALTPTGKGVFVHLSPATTSTVTVTAQPVRQWSWAHRSPRNGRRASAGQGRHYTPADRQALTCPETAGRRTHAWLAYARTPHLTKPCERHNVKTMPTSIIACASAKEEKPKVAFNICNWERTSLEMETGKNIKLNTSHLLTYYTAIKTMYNNINSEFNKEVLICNET